MADNQSTWKLKETKQCENCPWKKNANPHKIPNGYSVEKHLSLKKTIASDLDDTSKQLQDMDKPLLIMACHKTADSHCIGWLYNQLNTGNNVRLRIQCLTCENLDKVVIDGEQHPNFDATAIKVLISDDNN